MAKQYQSFVAVLQDETGASHNIIYRSNDEVNDARDIADQLQYSVVEVMPIDEFVQNNYFELCTL